MKNFKLFLISLIIGLSICQIGKSQAILYQKKLKSSTFMISAGTMMLGASMFDYNFYGPYPTIYYRPNFFRTYPRNLFFGVGVGLAVSGGVITYRFLR
jgi:hypothetical protein